MNTLMKTKIFNIIAAGCLVLATASCDGNWTPPSAGEGTLSLASMEVRNDDAVKLIKNDQSRAAVNINDYKVYISKKGEETPLYTYKYSEIPEILTLNVGEYTVDVKSHDVQKAEWERPYFLGSKDIKIESGKITDAGEIVCKFSSIKVTIDYTQELRSMLSEATVNVLVNDEGELDYVLGENKAGYFEALEGSSTIIVTFNGVVNGTPLTSSLNITDAEAGQHRIITFSVKNIPDVPEQTGTIDPTTGISIDASMITEDIDGNQTVQEDLISGIKRPWDPGEDPGPVTPPVGDEAITFTVSEGLNLDGPNPTTLDAYVIHIHSENGIENMQVDIMSDSQDFIESAGTMMPLSFDMAHLPDDLYETLKDPEIGLEGNEAVLHKNDVDFNITKLVPLLGAFPGTHKFQIAVTDTEGNKNSMTLIISAN